MNATTSKDKTFEQKRWERDVASHAHYSKMSERVTSKIAKAFCERRIKELEQSWPQLCQKDNGNVG